MRVSHMCLFSLCLAFNLRLSSCNLIHLGSLQIRESLLILRLLFLRGGKVGLESLPRTTTFSADFHCVESQVRALSAGTQPLKNNGQHFLATIRQIFLLALGHLFPLRSLAAIFETIMPLRIRKEIFISFPSQLDKSHGGSSS